MTTPNTDIPSSEAEAQESTTISKPLAIKKATKITISAIAALGISLSSPAGAEESQVVTTTEKNAPTKKVEAEKIDPLEAEKIKVQKMTLEELGTYGINLEQKIMWYINASPIDEKGFLKTEKKLRVVKAEIKKRRVDAEKSLAETKKWLVDAEKSLAETKKWLVDAEKSLAETEKSLAETKKKNEEIRRFAQIAEIGKKASK